jgi:hypothetical protein
MTKDGASLTIYDIFMTMDGASMVIDGTSLVMEMAGIPLFYATG